MNEEHQHFQRVAGIYGVKQFYNWRSRRMMWAALLTGLFLCTMVYVVARFLEAAL